MYLGDHGPDYRVRLLDNQEEHSALVSLLVLDPEGDPDAYRARMARESLQNGQVFGDVVLMFVTPQECARVLSERKQEISS